MMHTGIPYTETRQMNVQCFGLFVFAPFRSWLCAGASGCVRFAAGGQSPCRGHKRLLRLAKIGTAASCKNISGSASEIVQTFPGTGFPASRRAIARAA